MKHIAKTFTVAALAVLAIGVAPAAKATDRGCSNASLQGTFADKDTGFIYPAANAPVPFAGVNVETFDGNGNITGAGFASVGGGGAQWQTYTGTYKVNPGCTGTYSITLSLSGMKAHAFFVIDHSLNELQIVITDPGKVISCVARRQFPVDDWRQ